MDSFDSIIGLPYAVRELRRISDILRNPDAYLRAGLEIPKGLLITGEWGVGKTTLAKAFLERTGRKSFLIHREPRDGDLCDKIREVFGEAKEYPGSIIFLDDVEELEREDLDQDEDETLRYCMDELGDSDVFILSTAVKEEAVSLYVRNTGRFTLHLEVQKPTGATAQYLFRQMIAKYPLQGDLSIDDIVWLMPGRTCGELEKLLDGAVFFAESRNSPLLAKEDILDSYLMEQLGSSVSCLDASPDAAWQEAGRLAMAELLHENSAAFAVACQEDARHPKAFTVIDREAFRDLDEVMVLLAGRATVDLMAIPLYRGSGENMKRVVAFLRNYLSSGYGKNFTGLETAYLEEESKCRVEERQDAIQREIQLSFHRVQKYLCLNWELVEALAHALSEKRYLLHSEIQAIRKQCTIRHLPALNTAVIFTEGLCGVGKC